jgi:putative ATP-dependent endonuclease of OLD family
VAKTQADTIKNSGIAIIAVRIFNFRCLRAIEARLNPITILVGENNAGKTSFLEALHAAIGSGQRQFTEDDIWTDVNEKHAPKERSIIVDLLISPLNDQGKPIDNFPEGSPWLELWGSGVQQNDNDRDFAAIRTQYAWSKAKGEYVAERKFLKAWSEKLEDAPKTAFVERIQSLSVGQTTPIALYLLDAKRDGAEDIRVKGSVWHKLVSEQGQLQLKRCTGKHFQQEVFIPTATAPFHHDAVAAGMLLQQR